MEDISIITFAAIVFIAVICSYVGYKAQIWILEAMLREYGLCAGAGAPVQRGAGDEHQDP